MHRFRRFALAAVVLDALLSVGILLASGKVAEASAVPADAPAAVPAAVRFVPTEAGCAILRVDGEGAWRHVGTADPAACTAAR
jgi:hypothetical protein